MKKNFSISDTILEMFGGSKQQNRTFKEMSDEVYCGYVVGVVRTTHLRMDISTKDLLKLVQQMFKDGVL